VRTHYVDVVNSWQHVIRLASDGEVLLFNAAAYWKFSLPGIHLADKTIYHMFWQNSEPSLFFFCYWGTRCLHYNKR